MNAVTLKQEKYILKLKSGYLKSISINWKGQKFHLPSDLRGLTELDEEAVEDITEEKISEPSPLEVKVTNTPVKDIKWNDSKDDIEYDELTLSDEDKDI